MANKWMNDGSRLPGDRSTKGEELQGEVELDLKWDHKSLRVNGLPDAVIVTTTLLPLSLFLFLPPTNTSSKSTISLLLFHFALYSVSSLLLVWVSTTHSSLKVTVTHLLQASFSSAPSLQSWFPSHNLSFPMHCFSKGQRNLVSGHEISAVLV